MDVQVSDEVQVERQSLFTQMASAFARRDFEAVARGVIPDVVLTLEGSSWLAGTYRGYEGFSHYVAGARLVLEPAGRQITYLHRPDVMVVMHEFQIGGHVSGPEVALHVSVRFADDGRLAALTIRPEDQASFDAAVDSFLEPMRPYGQSA